MLKEFKQFVARGNIVEIAVGLVMAVAFKSVVDTVVANVLTPIIGAVFGQPDFSRLTIELWNGATITYGVFLNALFSFMAVAAAVFFVVVKPYNGLKARVEVDQEPEEDAPVVPPEDIVLLREIRDALRSTT